MAKLGRSLLAGETSVAELRTLTKKFKTAKHYMRDELATFVNDSVVVDGDLVIDGDFDTYAHKLCRLVITGDLEVSGLYRDHDDPETAVFVLGDFKATNAITAGALGVAGAVRVRDALVGYYNDHCAEFLGPVTTSMLIPENHFFSSTGQLTCDHLLGESAAYRIKFAGRTKHVPADAATTRALLVPEVLEIEDYGDPEETPEININDDEIRRRMIAGKPIRNTSKPITTNKKPAAMKPAAKKPVTKKPAAKNKKR